MTELKLRIGEQVDDADEVVRYDGTKFRFPDASILNNELYFKVILLETSLFITELKFNVACFVDRAVFKVLFDASKKLLI